MEQIWFFSTKQITEKNNLSELPESGVHPEINQELTFIVASDLWQALRCKIVKYLHQYMTLSDLSLS